MNSFVITLLFFILQFAAYSQPTVVDSGIIFTFQNEAAQTVVVAGDFNSWSHSRGAMNKNEDGLWETVIEMPPVIYQYKFIVDDTSWVLDPENPVTVENYNQSGYNNVFSYTYSGEINFDENPTLA